MPPEETPGLVTASDEAVHHVRHSPPPSSVIIGHHRDHKRKRTNHSVGNDDAVPQEQLTAASWSTVDADRGATDQPTMPTGGAHRSQRRAPAAERLDTGGSSSWDDKASPSVVPPPASSKAIRVKYSSSPSFVIGGSGGKQHPAAGSGSSPGGGSHSYYANSYAAAAQSSSKRLTIRGPAAPPPSPPPLHLPTHARRPRSAFTAPSAAVPLEPNDDECFRQGVKVFGEWDVATQHAAVNRFVSQQPPLPEGGGFSFWLTADEADADLKYVHEMVEEARRTSKAASGSGKPPRRH